MRACNAPGPFPPRARELPVQWTSSVTKPHRRQIDAVAIVSGLLAGGDQALRLPGVGRPPRTPRVFVVSRELSPAAVSQRASYTKGHEQATRGARSQRPLPALHPSGGGLGLACTTVSGRPILAGRPEPLSRRAPNRRGRRCLPGLPARWSRAAFSSTGAKSGGVRCRRCHTDGGCPAARVSGPRAPPRRPWPMSPGIPSVCWRPSRTSGCSLWCAKATSAPSRRSCCATASPCWATAGALAAGGPRRGRRAAGAAKTWIACATAPRCATSKRGSTGSCTTPPSTPCVTPRRARAVHDPTL